MSVIYESTSPEDTRKLAGELAKSALPGSVYALDGDLGAGKTAFSQGFAEGLGVTDCVNSPTFTILNIYESGRLPLYHFDVYRISDVDEMEEIGCDEFFYGNGVCLIEWASLIEEILPEGTVKITIKKDASRGFDFRSIEVDN